MRFRGFFFVFIILAIALSSFQATGIELGKKLDYEKADVYIQKGVTPEAALEIAKFFDVTGFYTGERKTIILKKMNDTYQMCFFKRAGASLGKEQEKAFQFYNKIISSKFLNCSPTETVFLDKANNSEKIIYCAGNLGKRLAFGKDEIFFSSGIDSHEAKKFGEYFLKTGFFKGEGVSILLKNNGDFKEISVISNGRWSKETFNAFEGYMTMVSIDLLEGQSILLKICDALFETQQEIEISGKQFLNNEHQKRCVANLRVITAAIEMYNMDHVDMIKSYSKGTLEKLIKEKYLKGAAANYMCPSKPSGQCVSDGDLSIDGFLKCTKHGTFEK